MPVTSSKLFIRFGFIAFFGFANIVVSFVPADAKSRFPISLRAKSMGNDWVETCRKHKDPKFCCRGMHDDRLKHCASLSDKKKGETCLQDADGSLLYCLDNVARGISSPPSVVEDPLKVAPRSPTIMRPNIKVAPGGALSR